ncbi:hypothetical protein AVEN_168219-1, partial [Araneus ventricosus]
DFQPFHDPFSHPRQVTERVIVNILDDMDGAFVNDSPK